MKSDQQKTKCLKSSVLSRIESDHMCPKSRLFFRSRECFVWFLWLFSVLFGALAVAVTLFVVMNHQYALYEATHDNLFTFVVEVLPYLWLIIFGLMTLVAIYNLRHTARGYRYPVSVILVSSVVLSLAGGAALQLFGLGYSVDHILGKSMKMYVSQEKLEERIWQMPSEGRLMGIKLPSTPGSTSTIVFKDLEGIEWYVSVGELEPYDNELLARQELVKLLGRVIDESSRQFHACGVFPQMVGKDMTMDKMSQERQRFVERVYRLADKRKDINTYSEGSDWSDISLSPGSICATIKPVRDMLVLPPSQL